MSLHPDTSNADNAATTTDKPQTPDSTSAPPNSHPHTDTAPVSSIPTTALVLPPAALSTTDLGAALDSITDESQSSQHSLSSLLVSLPNPDDSSADSEWGLTELRAEIGEMEKQRQREVQQLIQDNQHKVLTAASVLTPLPHQVGLSASFHSSVVTQYSNIHRLGLTPKQRFLNNKLKRRQNRLAKKAEDVADKQSSKVTRGREKTKQRRKAQY